jgi:hypothetical protein
MVCHFHEDVVIRVGAAAAESSAFECAKTIVKSGTIWRDGPEEFGRQLGAAADGQCRGARPELRNRAGYRGAWG